MNDTVACGPIINPSSYITPKKHHPNKPTKQHQIFFFCQIPEPKQQPPRVPTLSGRVNPPMPKPKPTSSSLYKHKSWSPDIIRDEEWAKRKNKQYNRRDSMKSVTDDDIDELKACIELGFGFDEQVNHHLSDTLPALPFYYAVNKRFQDTGSPVHPLLDAGDDPEMMKTRLRQWAQVVACSLRQSSSSSSLSSQGDHK